MSRRIGYASHVQDLAAERRAAAARERRAARKAARAAAPPPERDPVYDGLSLADLRDARAGLGAEETRVSYWLRIIQERLDGLRAEQPDVVRVDLARALRDAHGSIRRLAALDARPVDDVAPLPDLAEIWARRVDRTDATALARLERDLGAAERALAAYRQEVHRRADLFTVELIARYREQPQLALQILPSDPRRRHRGR
ncbi:MAG: hypothetical protein M0Z98_12480 [Actinomycetales bacterium]|nr:hypothetical protein [Actinomycetales bacterium]